MKLVFFDIECASVNKTVAKICAFGYVICDESFNIIKKEDILINPRGKFRLTDRKGDKGIVLPYDYNEFKRHPKFSKVYPYIKALLEDPENVVFGHSTVNDVKYLDLETKRFRLPSFNFRFTDSQLIYMAVKNDFSRQFGLEHIANDLGVEFTPHRAADDAYATMRVVQAMCAEKGCGYEQLLNGLGISFGKIENYVITRPQSQGMRAYNKEKSAEKSARTKARIEFFNYVSRKKSNREGKFRGTVFSFSRSIENDLQLSIPLVDRIYELGGKYSGRVNDCRYYVCGDICDEVRSKNARARSGVEVVNLDGLKELLR